MKTKIKYNCFKCRLPLNDSDHQIHLLTYNKKELIEDVRFHFRCWGEFNSEKVTNKFNESLKQGYLQLGEMLG